VIEQGRTLNNQKEVKMAQSDSSEVLEGKSGVGIDDLGDLPRSYGEELIFLVAQEPHWLFTYWDIDISKHPGGAAFLRVLREDGLQEAEIEVPFETRNWYIPVTEAGAAYRVEIGFYRKEEWHAIAESELVRTPPNRMSDSGSFDYASVPLHLTFHALSQSVQNAVRDGETLMQALARLQRDGALLGHEKAMPGPADERLAAITALLGRDFVEDVSTGNLSSQEIHKRIREAIEEKLTSAGASEFAARMTELGGGSGFFAPMEALASGEQVTSWSAAAFSSWAAAALASWIQGAQSSWGGVSSWTGERASGWTGETSGSWSGAAGASWGGESSWGAAELASWLQAAGASWAQAAFSSWNEQALSSWAKAAESSWTGASESVSSFGQPREFFMNVNAEVIFYGGTDPRAKVTVDGEPIVLSPAGTFRYHFIFPDGTYDIPIVAVSPDGQETRRAMLRFERGTEKVGGVDDTPQPPLDKPMGEKDA
jgi:hypothetical protein